MTTALPVSQFHADPQKCVACGQCVIDCPAYIIHLVDGVAAVTPEDDAECIGCQHCLAVCPYAAVSVVGKKPEDSRPSGVCDPVGLASLIRSRRSVRQFKPGVVDPAVLREVLETVSHAPTGVNMRDLRFTVVHSPEAMTAFRDRVYATLIEKAASIPADYAWMADMAQEWVDNEIDSVFRTAPHALIVTAGPNQVCKTADSVIALSYFDLYAQARGIGTTWWGYMEALFSIFPECRAWLGVPEDHEYGYAMLFGPQGVHYPRTAQHDMAAVQYVEKLG